MADGRLAVWSAAQGMHLRSFTSKDRVHLRTKVPQSELLATQVRGQIETSILILWFQSRWHNPQDILPPRWDWAIYSETTVILWNPRRLDYVFEGAKPENCSHRLGSKIRYCICACSMVSVYTGSGLVCKPRAGSFPPESQAPRTLVRTGPCIVCREAGAECQQSLNPGRMAHGAVVRSVRAISRDCIALVRALSVGISNATLMFPLSSNARQAQIRCAYLVGICWSLVKQNQALYNIMLGLIDV